MSFVKLEVAGKRVLVYSQPFPFYGVAIKDAESVGDMLMFWLKRPVAVEEILSEHSLFTYDPNDGSRGTASLEGFDALNEQSRLLIYGRVEPSDQVICLSREFSVDPAIYKILPGSVGSSFGRGLPPR